MNVRLLTGVIFVVIILGGLGLFFMNSQNTKNLAERISPTSTVDGNTAGDTHPSLVNSTTFTSNDGRVSLNYPTSWYAEEQPVGGKKGQFGQLVQSLLLQNTPLTNGETIQPENTVTITVEIQKDPSNLAIDALVDCTMKTITCEKIGIDSEQFIRSETVRNTGMKDISVATFYDSNILRLTAHISPGTNQESLTDTVNAIFTSIKFSPLPES